MRWAFLAAVVLAACGGAVTPPDAGAPVDAGTDEGTDAGTGPALPASPAPPVLTPCPAGWREVVDGDATVCDAFPATGHRADCAFGEAHFPGTPDCAVVGPACPADGWPAALPSGRTILFVDGAAPSGGDGTTRARAFQSPYAALSVAPPGALVALRAGVYDTRRLILHDGQALWGACTSGTRLRSIGMGGLAVVDLSGAGAEVRSLGIDGADGGGVRVLVSGTAVHDVVIHGTTRWGLMVADATATADGVVARDPAPGTSFTAVDVEGATAALDLDHAELEGDLYAGVQVMRDGAHATLHDVVVDASAAGARLGEAYGLRLLDAVDVTLERAAIVHAHTQAVELEAATAHVALRDVRIAGTLPGSGGYWGVGVLATGGRVEADRVSIDDARVAGVQVQGAGTTAVLRDVVVRGVEDLALDGTGGFALAVATGASATVERVSVARAKASGVFVTDAGSHLDATDLTVRDTAPARNGEGGRGVEVHGGATATLTRAELSDVVECGLFVASTGSAVDGSDVAVRRVASRAGDGMMGAGAWAVAGARLGLARVLVDDVHLAGIVSSAAQVTLTDATVRGVAASACSPGCADVAGGFGLMGVFSGTLTATSFSATDLALCGVVVGESSRGLPPTSVDLDHGVVDRAPVGACVQIDGYDTMRLRAAVQYRDVGVPLQATTYTLPAMP